MWLTTECNKLKRERNKLLKQRNTLRKALRALLVTHENGTYLVYTTSSWSVFVKKVRKVLRTYEW